MNKVFYFDIDGTLLPHGHTSLSEETIYALKKLIEKEHTVFIATGKHYEVAKSIGEHLGIKNYITTNGQQVHINDELIYENKISHDEVEIIRNISEQHDCTIGIQDSSSNYVLKSNNMEIDKINACFASVTLPEPEIKHAPDSDVLQLLVFGTNKHKIELGKKYKMFHWHEFGGDILPIESSKANGIKKIKHLFNSHESYAFGDGENDVEMFFEVDHSVAMGNAKDHVKEKAKFITRKDVENGVYHFLIENDIIEEMRK